MKKYHVKISNRALSDISSIYDYIADVFEAPETAMLQYNRIAEGINPLALLPMRCQQIFLKHKKEMTVRQLMVDNYSVIYTAVNETVTVLRVLYSSSDITSRLKKLVKCGYCGCVFTSAISFFA